MADAKKKPITEKDLMYSELFEAKKLKGANIEVNGKFYPSLIVEFLEGPNKNQEFKYGCVTDKAKETLIKNGYMIEIDGVNTIVVKVPAPTAGKEINWLNA